jgi:hypothetical protein
MRASIFQQTLRFVLAELAFPAERWQIVTTAVEYGAEASTCDLLRALPLRTDPYQDLQDIVGTLATAMRREDAGSTRQPGAPASVPVPRDAGVRTSRPVVSRP